MDTIDSGSIIKTLAVLDYQMADGPAGPCRAQKLQIHSVFLKL